MSGVMSMLEDLSRVETRFLKLVRRGFKSKEPGDSFLKTVKIFSPILMGHMEFKMRLDTGCEIHNLITSQVVEQLRIADAVIWEEEVLCTCLNGEQLLSTGVVVLRWKGKRFRKVFTTTFHVIDAGLLPWEVILGAETIQQHGILKFAGFGGAIPVLPKKKKDERNTAKSKKQDHKEKAAANDARVDADIKAKEDAARQRRSNTDDLNSGGSMNSR